MKTDRPLETEYTENLNTQAATFTSIDSAPITTLIKKAIKKQKAQNQQEQRSQKKIKRKTPQPSYQNSWIVLSTI